MKSSSTDLLTEHGCPHTRPSNTFSSFYQENVKLSLLSFYWSLHESRSPESFDIVATAHSGTSVLSPFLISSYFRWIVVGILMNSVCWNSVTTCNGLERCEPVPFSSCLCLVGKYLLLDVILSRICAFALLFHRSSFEFYSYLWIERKWGWTQRQYHMISVIIITSFSTFDRHLLSSRSVANHPHVHDVLNGCYTVNLRWNQNWRSSRIISFLSSI